MARTIKYRCTFLDAAGGVGMSETVECASAEEALGMSRKIWEHRPHYHGIELWEGFRRLHVEQRTPAVRPAPITRLRSA